MPTLGLDVKVILATDKTRQTLDNFYRGIKTEAAQIFPHAYLTEKGERVYDLEGYTFILFIGDVFDGSDPFDLTLINNQDEELTFEQTNFLMMNATNFKEFKVSSSNDAKVGYKVYLG